MVASSPLKQNLCPVCVDGQAQVRYAEARDYLTGDSFEVLECPNCQVAFTDPIPTDLGRYYPVKYRVYRGNILSILGSFYKARARGWARMFSKPGRLLEIGCGPGLMLRSMRDLGWVVKGLERNEQAAEYGRKQYGLDIEACDVEELPPQTFDLIVLFQVLEHMPNPRALLAECYQRLNPGGRIVIAVPNFHSWQARYGGTQWLHLDAPRHLFHFSPASLEKALGQAGFSNLSFQFVSWEHDPYGWVQTVLNQWISPSNMLLRFLMGLDASKAKVALSVIVGGIMAIPSCVVSIASFAAGRGAIVTVMAERRA